MSMQTVSVSLPSEIIYVSGTVNGVDKTWTLVDGSWQTTADRAEDDIYTVALTAVNAAGTSTSFELTLYYGVLNLITDRTQADVDNGTDKGYYNASDLNRVGAAVSYLAGRLDSIGCPVVVNPREDWVEADLPAATELAAYLADVATIRAALPVMESTPDVPDSMRYLRWATANDIERILQDIDTLITNVQKAWYFSGEVYAGEV